MLQLPHRDHRRHIMIMLSSYGSVSPAPRHDSMQVMRPITGVRRSSEGGAQLLLIPLVALGFVADCSIPDLEAWLVTGDGMGIPGCRAANGGIFRRSSVCMLLEA